MSVKRIVLLLALGASPVGAQIIRPTVSPHSWTDQWVFGVNGFGGIPVGDFRQNEDGGGGVELMTGFQPFRRKPLVLRGNFLWMQYGGLDASAYQDVCDEYSCWTELVTYRARQHNMMVFQGGPELMAVNGAWRPFAFALAGVTMFRSSAHTPASSPSGSDQDQKLFSSSNSSLAYGAGLRRVGSSWGREIAFEISARFTQNAKAQYVNEEGIQQQPDGTWIVTPRTGDANLVGIHVGLWIGPHVRADERR